MHEILPPYRSAKKICAPVRPAPGEYRWILHCLRVPCAEGTLLYHTLTGEVLLLSPEEMRRAEKEEGLRQELIRRRFLVPADFDEYAYFLQFRRVAELMAPKKREIRGFTIFTTTDCNARCPYCYELGRPRRSMSDQVARDTAAFIDRVCGGREVHLNWFGGEPLYNARAIDVITEELRMRGLSFRSKMISNGYLFDGETVRKAREDWALAWVQITLDGREQTYNRTKNYIYRDGSAYRRVLANMEKLLAADIAVTVRLNACAGNMDELSALADELKVRFKGQSKLSVYSVLLRDFSAADTHPETVAGAMEAWDALQRRIIASGLGLRRKAQDIKVNGCMADSDGSVTVLPDGRLGKCEHETERLLVGSIYEGIRDQETVARWKERVEVPACRTCPFAPSCVKLRLCDWTKDRCTATDRERMRLSASHRILSEYQLFLADDTSKGVKTDETETDVDLSGFGR